MAPSDSRQLDDLFKQAIALPRTERSAFLDEVCGADAVLRAKVEERLEEAESDSATLDSLAASVGTQADRPDPLIGRTLHQYQIEKLLGGGSMGVVYRARDTRLDRRVALKFLPPSLSEEVLANKRFLVEARAAAAIDHPNICTVYEIAEVGDGRLFISMAYYQGETLKKKVARGALPVQEAMSYAAQVALGLSAAHERRIVHRDIKPANVMVTSDGVAKVLDFGVAKKEDLSLTRVGVSVGTARYMSPEQIQDDVVDSRTDIWSLGVVLYEMLTGQQPFGAGTEASLIYQIISEDPEPINAKVPSAPAALNGIVMKALSKDPDDRYGTAKEFAAELFPLLDGTSPGLLAGTGFNATRRSARSRLFKVGVGAALVAAVLVVVAVNSLISGVMASDGPPAVAVLPFENLSADPADQYFTDGVHDEIITRLSKVSGLHVIARASVLPYRDSGKDPRTIAEELSVGLLVSGSVQRFNDRVKINAALVDAERNANLWSETFEEAWEDLFAIQRQVGEGLARSLNVRLSAEEKVFIGEEPTADMVAHDFFLRGKDFENRSSRAEPDLRAAVAMYERAVESDPAFALAYSQLGYVHLRLYWFGHDRTPERLASSREAIARAFELEPELPEAHLTQAWYYYQAEGDFGKALRELGLAEQALGAHPDFYRLKGAIQRRAGSLDEAVLNFTRALEHDPLYTGLAMDIGNTYAALRRHDEANRYFEREIQLGPARGSAYWWKAWNHILWTGDLEEARSALQAADRYADRSNWTSRAWHWHRVETLSGNHQAALDHVLEVGGTWIEDQYGRIPTSLLIGESRRSLSEPEAARDQFEASLAALESAARRAPDDAFTMRNLALTHLGLGNRDEAIRYGRRAVDLMPITRDALLAPDYARDLAAVYAYFGQADNALDLLESLMARPGRSVSASLLGLDPVWDPLRDNPRFQGLLTDP